MQVIWGKKIVLGLVDHPASTLRRIDAGVVYPIPFVAFYHILCRLRSLRWWFEEFRPLPENRERDPGYVARGQMGSSPYHARFMI